jgi:alkaline phosphatase
MNPDSQAPAGASRRTWLKGGLLAGLAGAAGPGARPLAAAAPSLPAAKPRGIVFMVSDGMSAGVPNLAELLSRRTRQRGTRWWQLLQDPKAVHGFMDTASADSPVTDSAAAASAWGSGTRINNGAVNHSPEGRELQPIAALLQEKGRLCGLVSTATITHATPAGFAASTPDRNREADIAPQYLERVHVLLGGGSQFFDPAARKDGADLPARFRTAGYHLARTKAELPPPGPGRLLGLFAAGHLPFSVDHQRDPALLAAVPTLAELAKLALASLLAAGKPFLLQVEGARIDHAAHANDIAGLLWDQLAFDEALAAVLDALAGRDDILVVVTSDHGNSNPGLNGMGAAYRDSGKCFDRIQRLHASHEALLGIWKSSGAKGPGAAAKLVEEHLGIKTDEKERAALAAAFDGGPVHDWHRQQRSHAALLGQIAGNHTGIGWTGVTHTAEPTIVTALGPQANRFHGLTRNDAVHGHLAELLG